MVKFLISLTLGLAVLQGQVKAQQPLSPWQPGMLDIHFIETGHGNASFMVFPDGTTMLVDAGDLNAKKFNEKYAPLKATQTMPNDEKRAGQWIVSYIKQVMPANRRPQIDYALITHFHEDHYGEINKESIHAVNKSYQLSGITDVGNEIPIARLLDRGLSYPVDLQRYYQNSPTFVNYLAFIKDETKNGLKHEMLQAGSHAQVSLKYEAKKYPNFLVRNIKANNKVWSGRGDNSYNCFPDDAMPQTGFNENPLSNVIKVSYGNFSFYTGGDNTGYEGAAFPGRKNVELAIAKAVGKVTVMSLNHHGNRDANNPAFIDSLSPDVVVQQSWCTDQPGQDLAFRLTEKNSHGNRIALFNTYMQAETQVYLGPWITDQFKSLQGHILIRVSDAGDHYSVYILNGQKEKLEVVKTFGPYSTHHP